MSGRSLPIICYLATLAAIGCVATDDTVEISCPDKFSLVVDKYCFFKSSDDATWDHATSVCETSNGWLATLESAYENEALLDWLFDSGMSFSTFFSGPYIGLRRTNMSSSDFVWSHAQESTYTNWKTRIPYISSDFDNCAVMTADGTWFNFKCTDKRDFICEIDPILPAPSAAPSLPSPPTPRPSRAPHPSPSLLPTRSTDSGGAGHSGGDSGDTSQGGNTGSSGSSGGGGSHVTLNVHMSYIFIGVCCVAIMALFWHFRPNIRGLIDAPTTRKPRKGSVISDFDEANSSHNLMEMQTIKIHGDAGQRSEEVDLGGCFAFGDSSAEEMLASQLHLKVYSSVDSEANEC